MGATKRARYGRGSVWQAKDRQGRLLRDVWRYCYSWTDKAGNRHRENGTHHGTKGEALAIVEGIKRTHDDGLRLDGSEITFGAFAQSWQETREAQGELTRRTLEESAQRVRIVCGYIGDKPLTDINAETIEGMLKDLKRARTGKDGGQIGGRTMLAYYQCTRQILQKACDYDYIMRNPCAKVKPPKTAEVERRALSTKDARRLLATLERDKARARAAYAAKEQRQTEWRADEGRGGLRGLHALSNIVAARLGLATGMRLGEVLGLTWGAVDLQAQCLHVTQTLTHHGETKPPKTAAGRRTIWIDTATAAHLSEWKRFQAAQLRKIGKLQEGQRMPATIPVVCSDVGGYANTSNFEAWWRTWREANGFNGLKFHELRHTQATQLLANGVDVKTVQTRLGHTDPALTLKWYAHSVEENDRQAAALMGGLLASAEQVKRG